MITVKHKLALTARLCQLEQRYGNYQYGLGSWQTMFGAGIRFQATLAPAGKGAATAAPFFAP